jgi:transglutaminase-like putative cysteine protease
VNGHVLGAEYSYRLQFGEPLPTTSELVLEMQAGWCGDASAVFAEIVNALGLPVRRVAFYPTDPDLVHTAAETYYDGAWHYFDPTWGAVYGSGPGDAVSITEARARQLTPTRDDTLIWGMRKPSLSELTDPTTRVEFDNPPF